MLVRSVCWHNFNGSCSTNKTFVYLGKRSNNEKNLAVAVFLVNDTELPQIILLLDRDVFIRRG